MWYRDAMARPLQVSFWLCNGVEAQYHETELADRAGDISDIFHSSYGPSGATGLVLLDGYVSVVFNGEELLGDSDPAHWIEFIACAGPAALICDGGESVSFRGVTWSQSGESIAFSTRSHGGVVRSTLLPLQDFAREWTLMLARVDRVRAALGDRTLDADFLKNPMVGRCRELVDLVGAENLVYTGTEPLGNLLRNPLPGG
jgi:hypothetical protein